MPTTAPYGSWKSPITAEMLISGGKRRLNEIKIDGSDIYWLDARPAEAGRIVIMRRTADGTVEDLTPAPFNSRNAVHEYGGGSLRRPEPHHLLHQLGRPANLLPDRQRNTPTSHRRTSIPPIHPLRRPHHHHKRQIHPLRPRDPSSGRHRGNQRNRRHRHRHRRAENHRHRPRLLLRPTILSIPRRHRMDRMGPPQHAMGRQHPSLQAPSTKTTPPFPPLSLIAGGQDESIVQPTWGPNGLLHFVTDRTGWWNIHAWKDGEPINLRNEQSDHGRPDWQFAFTSYAHLPDNKIALGKGGVTDGSIVLINSGVPPLAGEMSGGQRGLANSTHSIEIPYSEISFITAGPDGTTILFVGASPTAEPAIISLDLETERCTTIYAPSDLDIEPGYLSSPRHIIFPTTDNGQAHAFYYEPTNKDFTAPNDELPPLVTICHGGPTSASGTGLDLSTHYWTSRGFAVVDVNYRGSSGYGKVYRDALKGKWGIYDTDDCIAAAQHLIDQNLVDKDRIIIRGGSAGGYTTINALTFHNFFAAGAALYGIADLMVFIGDTHKFESRYLDSLVGPYPEEAQRYHDRSAINFMDQLATPMIILQGLEDEIVPPSQAEIMVNALESKGLPYAYIGFPGEQHGFRQAANIIRAQQAELHFYGKVLNFQPADQIPEDTVEVRNLD